jgi:hypothetical protein
MRKLAEHLLDSKAGDFDPTSFPDRYPPVPSRDGTVYLVLDDFGKFGQAYRETDPTRFMAPRRPRYFASDHCGTGMARAISGAKADMTRKGNAQRRASFQ